MSKTRNETLCSKVQRKSKCDLTLKLQCIFAEKGFKFFSTKIMSSNFTQMAFGAFKETTLEEQYHEHEHEHEHGSHGHEHEHEHEYEHERT